MTRALTSIAALLVALAVAAPAAAARRAPLSARALEARHGLRVTRVAVVGGGGLIDLRFQVVDAAKARRLLDAHHATPTLRPLASRAALSAEHAPHCQVALRDQGGPGGRASASPRQGIACFVLFPNRGGALRPGGRVAVRFGAVELEPVAAQ